MDALVDAIIAAKTRAELTTACKALDRVIRAGRYWVPQWYKPSHWLAYWDVYGHGIAMPRYDRGVLTTWWWDAAAAPKAIVTAREFPLLFHEIFNEPEQAEVLSALLAWLDTLALSPPPRNPP